MHTFIISPVTEIQEKQLEEVLQKLNIPFEISDETAYVLSNEYLSNKILQGRKDMEEGKGKKMDLGNLWK